LTHSTQLCSVGLADTSKSTTLELPPPEADSGETEHPAGEITGLLASISDGLNKLCDKLTSLDNVMKKRLADAAVSKAQEEGETR